METFNDKAKDMHRLQVITDTLIYMEAKIKQIKQERKEIIRRLGKQYDNFKKPR